MERTWCKQAPAADLLIKGGRVVDPEAGIDAVQDVLIGKGKVAELGSGLNPGKNTREIDARGMLVLPGFVDLHAHLRTPGREDEEDITSGTRAAGDAFLLLAAGRAQVRVEVDEAGQHEHAAGVDLSRILARIQARAELGDLALADQHVLDRVDTRLGVDHPAALDEEIGRRRVLAPRALHQRTSSLATPSL